MKVIINADDFGASERHSICIIDLLVKKKITSTTFLVNTSYSDKAAKLINEKYPELIKQMGIHLNFISSSPLNPRLRNTPLVDTGFIFKDFRKHLGLLGQLKYLKQIMREVDMQIQKFHSYFGKYPTHIDSHGHTHCTFIMLCAILLSDEAMKIDSIRISRQYNHEKNIKKGLKYIVRKILKNLLNTCYRFKFRTEDYFTDIKNLDGSYLRKEDLEFLSTKFKVIEIMTHPYYTDEKEYQYLLLDNNVFSQVKEKIELINYSDLKK